MGMSNPDVTEVKEVLEREFLRYVCQGRKADHAVFLAAILTSLFPLKVSK